MSSFMAVNLSENDELCYVSRPAEYYDTSRPQRCGAKSIQDKQGLGPVPVTTSAEEPDASLTASAEMESQTSEIVDSELLSTSEETQAEEPDAEAHASLSSDADIVEPYTMHPDHEAQWEEFVSLRLTQRWVDIECGLETLRQTFTKVQYASAHTDVLVNATQTNEMAVKAPEQTITESQATSSTCNAFLAASQATSQAQHNSEETAHTSVDVRKATEKRWDQADGKGLTLSECKKKYKNYYSMEQIEDYFYNECREEPPHGYIWVGIKEFKESGKKWVGSRIIGCKGAVMQGIISACGGFEQCKLRLRGEGSGYLEEGKKESKDPLMICISCTNEKSYCDASAAVLQLVNQVQAEYYQYCAKKKIPCPELKAEVIRGFREGSRSH